MAGCCSLACCKSVVLIVTYFWLCFYMNYKGTWRAANEWDVECDNTPFPVNNSGLKVLLAGWGKSGTWTMSHALGQLGLNSYHSQEFLTHVWNPIADEYWMRPENGARRSKNFGFHLIPFHGGFVTEDLDVLSNLKTETLARGLSKCRVDATALDGLDRLHEPVIDASPDVKVLLLDWRDYKSWTKSNMNQVKSMMPIILTMELFYSSLHFLPWGLLVKAIDPLINNDIEKLLKTGGPPFIQKCPLGVMMWHPFVKNRFIWSHLSMGLSVTQANGMPNFPDESEFKALFERVRQRVPAKRIMSWNFKNKTWEDLCAFLGIKECPNKGKVKTAPNGYTDLWRNGGRGWDFNCDEPFVFIPVYLLIHWVNWKVFTTIVVTLPGLLLSRSVRQKRD